MVRVGLIGFGLAGQAFHAPVIRGVEGMELACILERHGSNAKQRYPEVRVARTLDEMLSDKTINLCVVATPNDSHYSYTKACLEAGRDVVVDKPFTPTMAEAEQLVRLAADRGRLITVYQDRRWDGEFHTVKATHQSRDAGISCRVRISLRPLSPGVQTGRMARASRPSCGRGSVGSRSTPDRSGTGSVWHAGNDLGLGILPASDVADR